MCPCWQAAIARSSKWGTTEPSSRPSPARQGSQGSEQLEAMGSAGSGGLPTRPPLPGMSDSPRPTKLDALLHAQQLAQQQQQQQHSGSSSQEGKPGQAGLGSRRAFSGQLPATQSAAQFGVAGAQVSIPIPRFDCQSPVPCNRRTFCPQLRVSRFRLSRRVFSCSI